MADLYGWRPGQLVDLPLGSGQRFRVIGIWRDYARQHGAIVMRASDYTRLTGDASRGDVAFTLRPGAAPREVAEAARSALPPALARRVEISEPAAIRQLSLRIFDRSFAVTWVLQTVAIVIGLAGVTASFAAQALARAREFGMLRHLGVTRHQVLGMLAGEGMLLGLLGVLAGIGLGLAMSRVLIDVVNPQSFHWTMETHVPWAQLGSIGIGLPLLIGASAVLAGRRALSVDAVRAVREDW